MSFLEKLHPSFRTPGDQEPNIAYFIARLGGEGERWVEEYTRPEHLELMARTNRSLAALRARRLEEGRRELQRVESLYQKAGSTATLDVYHILGRWYYGLLAYYLYCTEDYPGADQALDRGHEEVRQAIESKLFLVPYAMECCVFWFQRIRVARSQRLWPEVWRRAETTRQILANERPCCVLSDGTRIDVAAIQAFYMGFEALTDSERRPLRRIIDPAERARQIRAVFSDVYALPGFVIPYTPDTPAQPVGSNDAQERFS
jgi:hypothetical protein